MESWNMLLSQLPAFERYFRILLQNHLITTPRRVLRSMSQTAEQKYLAFVDQYPDCVQRVPQHMIASFLGIAPETLSRLRRSALRRPKS